MRVNGKTLILGGVVVGAGVLAYHVLTASTLAHTASGPCDTTFKTGIQYVAARNAGAYTMYDVVVGGRLIGSYSDQHQAENVYNQTVCGGR